MDRKKVIQQLRDKRYTFQKIGDLLGISRQRVHQILTGRKRSIRPYHLTKKFNNSFLFKVLKNKYSPSKIFQIRKANPQLGNLAGTEFLAEIVRIRDNHTCQICGKVWLKGTRRFDTHHLDEKDENKHTYENYKKFDRMITLCHKCHLNLEHIRKKMRGKRKKILSTVRT